MFLKIKSENPDVSKRISEICQTMSEDGSANIHLKYQKEIRGLTEQLKLENQKNESLERSSKSEIYRLEN